MANKLLVDLGVRNKIRAAFNCSYPTISTALNGSENTALQKKIRVMALQLGGIEVKAVTISEETEVVTH